MNIWLNGKIYTLGAQFFVKKTYKLVENFKEEFGVIDIILNTNFETRGVDAFSLSIIKAERQIRKIFTFLIYQNASFNETHIKDLVQILAENKYVYFKGFISGIDNLYTKTTKEVFGSDYDVNLEKLIYAESIRNKIFHGQLTGKNLSRDDLKELVDDIQKWSRSLAEKFNNEIGYDGLERDSFKKSKMDLSSKYKISINSIGEYKTYIHNYLEKIK